MILAFTVLLDIENPMKARVSDEIREEYRENISLALVHRRNNIGFSGELIDELDLGIDAITVVPSAHP